MRTMTAEFTDWIDRPLCKMAERSVLSLKHKGWKLMKIMKTLIAAFVLLAVVLFAGAAVQAAQVSTDEEFMAALLDENTDTITLNCHTVNLSGFAEIDRNLTIDGNGAVITAKNGIHLTFKKGTSLVLKNVVLTGERDFVIKSYGNVELTGTVEFAGGYGLLMNNGSSLNSSAVLVSRTENKIALAANPNGGEVVIGNVNINDTTTNGTLLYIYRGGGALYFSGNSTFKSAYGSAVSVPTGGRSEQKIILYPYASVTAEAPGAAEGGAAFNVRECALELGKGAQLNAKGSYAGVYCDTLRTEAECAITAENTANTNYAGGALTVFGKIAANPTASVGEKNKLTFSGYNGMLVYGCASTFIGKECTVSTSVRSGNTIDSESGAVVIGDNVTVNSKAGGTAIEAKGNISLGSGCELNLMPFDASSKRGINSGGQINIGGYTVVRCIGAEKALEASDAIVLSDYSTADFENVGYGAHTGHGVQTGKGCMVTIKNASKYGICATGTLLADIVSFGEENTVGITSKGTALYSAEAVIFNKGSKCTIESGNKAPAICVDTLLTTQGYLRVTGSEINIKSGLTADSGEAAISIVGSAIIEDGSRLNIESSSAFGILCRAGDLIVGTNSLVCSEGGCAVFIEDGNIRISQGGSLCAKGTLDSGIRVSNGMLRVGEGSTIITEGERFGAEILVYGGIWLENPKLFDFRSTASNAVYIHSGVFSAIDTDTVSAWYRKQGKSNKDTWWNADVSEYKAWEINSKLSEDKLHYADYTQHDVNATARFENGAETSSEGFEANISYFRAGEATRISSFKTRPISSPNYLFIPSGRSFSWRLEAKSVEGEGERFTLVSEPNSGTVRLSENGILSYSAPVSTRGEQVLTYVVTGLDEAESLPVEVTINVTKSKPPAAYSHTFDVKANGSLITRVSATDFDGTVASLTVTREPEHGKISLASDGTLRYTPEGAYTGFDSFAYFATDNDSDNSNEAVVTFLIGIWSEATADNATYIAAKNETTSGKFSINLPKDDAFDRIEITTFPRYGELEVNGLDFVYSPPENFAGTETFGYTAVTANGIVSNEAFVSIITVPSEKPKADSLKIDCASGKGYSGKLSAKDLDGKITTYMIETYPEHGTLDFSASNGSFTYTAEGDYTGEDSFTFYVYDDEGLKSETAAVNISVDTYLNILRSGGELTRIIITAVILFAVITTLAVIIITGTVRKRRKQDREFEEQYNQLPYDDYYGY